MINIKNTQRTMTFNTMQFKKNAQHILHVLGYKDFDLSIWLTTNATIRKYNKQYRNKDKATDILSFAYHHTLKAGDTIVAHTKDDRNMGDIMISLEYVQKDASKWDHSFAQRMDVLLVHGICHLLGYDHIQDTDYVLMKAKEELLLKEISR